MIILVFLAERTQLANIYICVFAGNETFERLATFGLLANFMVYLMKVFHLEQVSAANILNIWSGATNFAPLVGAFISDAYVGRFKTIAFASCAALLVHFCILIACLFMCRHLFNVIEKKYFFI